MCQILSAVINVLVSGFSHQHCSDSKPDMPPTACFKIVWSLRHQIIINHNHYSDVIMSAIAAQITSVLVVYSTICWSTDQRKRQRSASLGFVREFTGDRWNSPHKGPPTRKMFPFDDTIMIFAMYDLLDLLSKRFDMCPWNIYMKE